MSLYLAPAERPLGDVSFTGTGGELPAPENPATQILETDPAVALIAAYLAGEMTIDEMRAFGERMEREPVLRDVVHALEQIWAPPASQPAPLLIAAPEPTSVAPVPEPPPVVPVRRRRVVFFSLPVAVVIALIAYYALRVPAELAAHSPQGIVGVMDR